MEVEKQVHALFIANQWTLSLAESCTGGALTFRFVQLPECSVYLLGSVVAYSNEAKENILNVRRATLKRCGAVSEEAAREMGQGALNQFRSDYALATTGIAGPSGGSEQKPVGTVCFALVSQHHLLFSWTARFKGDRKEIITAAVDDAIQHLFNYVNP